MSSDGAFPALLEFLKRSRGFDFTGYKRASLERRFRRRMETVGCEDHGAYRDYLEVHPDEYELLFDTLLINVTQFFRDPHVWSLPAGGGPAADPGRQAARRGRSACGAPAAPRARRPYRRHAARRVLGAEEYRERVKIYATDIDEDALGTARRASLPPRRSKASRRELRERYFERVDQRYAFRKDMRRTRDLRPQQPDRRRADLAPGPAGVPQHADVLQRGDPGAILRHLHFALRRRRASSCSASRRC